MSFILDALKKLEEKRHNESVPDLSTIHTEDRTGHGKRHHLLYILIAVLFLNALVLAVWLRPQQEENNLFSVQASKEKIDNSVPAVPASDKEPTTMVIPQEQKVIEDTAPDKAVTESRDIQAIEIASLPMNPSPEEIAALKYKIAKEQLLVNAPPAFEPALEEENSESVEGALPDMSQLPLSIRERLPDLTIAGHIYSNDPVSRLVNINGSVIREGETVTTGLTVNEITISGVILDYEGLLFKIRAF